MRINFKKLLFAAVLILLPIILVLGGLEILLRVAGFGYETKPLVQTTSDGRAWWVGNPDFTRLYFPAALKRLPPPNRIPVEKGASTRRYMIVGGSAAAGDPDTDFSIARNLEWILSASQSGLDVEVINLAYTACNSHVAVEVVRQARPYDLDGIIVLVGNNEVIGPFGPGTTLTESLPSLARRDWMVRLRKSKLGQLGQILREATSPAPQEAGWQGMKHFLEHRIAASDPRLQTVYANFQANLEAIESEARRMGIPVLLATVPVNLADHPPFQDTQQALPEHLQEAVDRFLLTGESSLDLSRITEAAAHYPGSANLNYMVGSLLLTTGQVDKCNPFFEQARDLDRLRFRADSPLNAIIRSQWDRPGTAWIAVDAETPLIQDNPRGVLGFPHFYEHVHYSFRANFLIAREMAQAILAHEGRDPTAAARLDWSQATAGLAYTPFEAWNILTEITQRIEQPPFSDIMGYDRMTAWMRQLRDSLEDHISLAEEKARMNEAYVSAIRARPQDDRLRFNFAVFLTAFGRPEAAFEIVMELYPRHPTDSELAISAFKLALQLNRKDAAKSALERLETIFPEHPGLAAFRGELARLPD